MNQISYFLFIGVLVPVTSISQSKCRDRNVLCDLWHSQGACKLIPKYMLKNCRKRCGLCDAPPIPPKPSTPGNSTECRDKHKSCEDWSLVSVCKKNTWMQKNCKSSCGLCDDPPQENKGIKGKKGRKTKPPPPSTKGKKTKKETKKTKKETKKTKKETKKSKKTPSTTPVPIATVPPKPAWESNCGVRSLRIENPASRIVGGDIKGAGRWPWQVGLYRSRYDRRPHCGGTLIKPDVVLTAAHCKPRSGEFVKVGDYDTRYKEGTEQLVSVEKVFTHERYELYSYRNDIALLRLSKSVKLGDAINTACLPKTRVAIGEECFVTGWGHIGVWNYHSATLREAKVPIIDNRYCSRSFRRPVTKYMMCDGGVGACKGDSGGPLVCKKDGKFELHGIISWGNNCRPPGVYTDVSKYLGWIKEKSNVKLKTFVRPSRPRYPVLRYPWFWTVIPGRSG